MTLTRRHFLARPRPAILTGCAKPDDWRTRVEGRWIGDNATLGHRVRDARARRTRPRARASGAATCWWWAAASRACRRRARCSARASPTSPCSNSRTRPAATAAATRCTACAARSARTTCRCPGPARRRHPGLAGRDRPGQADRRRPEVGRAPPVPQPAGAPVHQRPLAGRPAAATCRATRATQAQYRRFARAIADAGRLGFALPTARAPWTPAHAALDAVTAAQWLREQGLDDPLLLAYLDYCCRDDYGAGTATVSAWALVHYFASRHGFGAPGDDANDRDPVLTWPDGNAPLARRAAPAVRRPRAHRARRVPHRRGPARRHGLGLRGRGGRALDGAPRDRGHAAVHRRARAARAAGGAGRGRAGSSAARPGWWPTCGSTRLPLDRVGAPLSWDNVIHGSPSLGYVDAQHQSLGARRRRAAADARTGPSPTPIASACCRCRGRTRRS